jgi:nucleoside-diphosphate kinase
MKKQRTLVLIKPDGVQRGLIGEIVSRFERVGLKIVGLRMFVASPEQTQEQYGPSREEIEALGKRSIENQEKKYGIKTERTPYEQGEMIVEKLKRFMSCGPIVAMVLEGNQAVKIVRKLVGATEPLSSDVGTIRGDLTIDSYPLADKDGRAVRNIIHRSGSKEEAEREIKIWFKPEEIVDYSLISERILYDVNLDGILE